MTENERVKELRRTRGLTQSEFGEKLGVQNSAISKIERGENIVTDQMRLLISREFNVREEWLRDGVGPMEIQRNRSDEIEHFLQDIRTSNQPFRTQLVALLARLTPEEWALLESMAIKLADEFAVSVSQEARERAEAEELARQILEDKKAKDASPVLNGESGNAKMA